MHTVHIKSWNIDGAFTLKMSCPDFRKTLQLFDINFFQETHLRPNQHDTVILPAGYQIFSRTRRPKADFDKSWGGVAAVVSQKLSLKYRQDLSGPDFMVLQIGSTLFYNVYLLPETSNWPSVLESDPCEALASSLALAHMANFSIILMGDLNARTASLTAYPLDPRRTSQDSGTVSTRGRWLCRMLAEHDLVLINGTRRFGDCSGNYTSFQGTRRTVIDYAITSRASWDALRSFSVCPREVGYDHAALTLSLEIHAQILHTQSLPPRKQKKDVPLPTITSLDRLLVSTLEAAKDDEKKDLALFGPVLATTEVIKVSVHGLCSDEGKHNAKAGAGLYWGPNSRHNSAHRIPDSNVTSTYAELYAIAQALTATPEGVSLEITTHSEYAIQAIIFHAADHATRGW
ncbi:hypothetical protein LshimejAT787_0212210 [Lyophyllum shimeji]|uniref:RNase H type-1 domain-containing protein n=1 Tax=Lyophyllum shimeji TaxID=47721 RepID=A0A9P3PHN4_LYOSH|nr:hypothetical protein LshimejAT787_0212210 [Lyophyllum shimeji]